MKLESEEKWSVLCDEEGELPRWEALFETET